MPKMLHWVFYFYAFTSALIVLTLMMTLILLLLLLLALLGLLLGVIGKDNTEHGKRR